MRTYKTVQNPITVQSFGGGVQSVALLILNIISGEDFIPVFANVGDNAENPDTLSYIAEYVKPLCIRNYVPFLTTNTGDLYDEIVNNPHPSIPVFSGKAQFARICTSEKKVKPVDRSIKRLLKPDENGALVQLGISIDELQRAKFGDWEKKDAYGRYFGFWKKLSYPLVDAGLSREDCKSIIRDYGLPVPPKSSCWFCPFGKGHTPQTLNLEKSINSARHLIGLDEIQVRRTGQLEECGGYCHT